MLDLSVAMLVRNPPIERLVQQIDFMSAIASEFIVVDTGSTNEELQAMAYMNKAPFSLPKLKILRREWRDDFAWARNEGLDAVTRSWTLVLDPDEMPSIRMMSHIRSVVSDEYEKAPSEVLGYQHFSLNYFNGFLEPEQHFHWHVRLFRTGVGRFYRALDELVSLDGIPEDKLRNTTALPKAPKDAYFIHSKASDAIEQSEKLYESMRADGADHRGLLTQEAIYGDK